MAVKFASGLEDLFVPIDSVRQHPRNPNNGDLDSIMESIKINGYVDPIIVQKSTGYIIAGNHRWQCLHALKSTVAPVIFVDMDEEQALRFMLANNETARKAVTDDALMVELLGLLSTTELGLVGSGFDDDQYQRLMAGLDQDALPEVPMGGGGIALNGIYEVTVSFDNEGDRDALEGELRSRFDEEDVRKANV